MSNQGIRPASPCERDKNRFTSLYMEQNFLLFGIGQTSLKALATLIASKSNRIPVIIKERTNLVGG